MSRIVINGKKLNVPKDHTVMQACMKMGLEIPHFCFHERLSIAGNCRMCLVEQKGVRNPVASCALPVSDGMEIVTDSPKVKKAREGVMEFLLINHPLDCPICDQGGECDLQDQAMAYGRAYGRFNEQKRAVEEKNLGPLIQTYMTRCIHCTRCIRFATEIAGVEELGATGRGEDVEIGTYVENALVSELSGNMIDLCPVGALTSKPYAGTARSWELTSTESIDVLDAVGSNIRIDSRGREVMRILPRLNDKINEEWISDKTRFAYDGLKVQRLDRPWLRGRDGRLREVGWQTAINAVIAVFKKTEARRIGALVGDLCCAESMYALLRLFRTNGSPSTDCRQDGARLDAADRNGYLFNTTIAGIEQADACLLVGCNPRTEAPLINARLRKRWLMGGFKGFRLGEEAELNWSLKELGVDPKTLLAIAVGSHPIAKQLRRAKKPMLIIGQSALAREDGAEILATCRRLAQTCNMVGENWNGFNVLHRAAARTAALDMGFVPVGGGVAAWRMGSALASGKLKVLWLLGADEIDLSLGGKKNGNKGFVIYQGHHGDRGASAADVILPSPAYTEKDGIYVNTEGRLQHGFAAVRPPGQAKAEWEVINRIAIGLGFNLGYSNHRQLRRELAKSKPLFADLGLSHTATSKVAGRAKTALKEISIGGFDGDFYQTDPICRASVTMAKCSVGVATPGSV